MSNSIYTTSVWGDKYSVEADFAQASSPVLFTGETTPYQVADFGHNAEAAMRRQLTQAAIDSGSAVDEDGDLDDEEAAAQIEDAVGRMRDVSPVPRAEKISEAAAHIDASPAADADGYLYYADETSRYYRVDEDDLVELYDLLHHEDEDLRGSAYSHWCAGTLGEELTEEEAETAGLLD